MVTTESSPKPVKVFPFKSSVIDLLILMFSVTSFASTTVSPFSAASIASCNVSYCVPSMVAACFTSPVVSLPLPPVFPPSPLVGVVLPSPFSDSPPLTGVGKDVKISFPSFCPSPEGVGVPSVPEGGAVWGFCPPLSDVLTGSVPLLLLAPLSLDEPPSCSVAGALFVC